MRDAWRSCRQNANSVDISLFARRRAFVAASPAHCARLDVVRTDRMVVGHRFAPVREAKAGSSAALLYSRAPAVREVWSNRRRAETLPALRRARFGKAMVRAAGPLRVTTAHRNETRIRMPRL